MTQGSVEFHDPFSKSRNKLSDMYFDKYISPYPLLSPITKNSLTGSNIQRMIGSIVTHYLDNPDESRRWKARINHDTSGHSSLSQSLNVSPSSSVSLLTHASPMRDMIKINLQTYLDSILDSTNEDMSLPLSVFYFSSLPASVNNLNKPEEMHDHFIKNSLGSGTSFSSTGANKGNFLELLKESKRKLCIDFAVHNNFPSEEDAEMFHLSIENAKRQRFSIGASNVAPLNDKNFKQTIEQFYISADIADAAGEEQLYRQKLPHFLDSKDGASKPSLSSVLLGDIFMDVWYNSPFPSEYVTFPKSTLWICPWCLKYCSTIVNAPRHKQKCHLNRPPGKEIHRQKLDNGDKILIVFEVDGSRHKGYCQNLCLLAKCFLDHKILYYDVNSFCFYVLAEYQKVGDHEHGIVRIIGYFSKERNTEVHNNVSCIVIFPAYQGLRYGQYLIDFSYMLTRAENLIGGPETPLSDLGFLSYSKYWMEVLVSELRAYLSSKHDCRLSWAGIHPNHILATLEWMNCLMKDKDGGISINMDRFLKHPDYLEGKIRPWSKLLRLKTNKFPK